MKSNTKKFLDVCNIIYQLEISIENDEYTPSWRITNIKNTISKFKKDEFKYASKISEDEFNNYLGDLCINSFEDFQDAYNLR